jgi:transposase InsO family protein
MTGKRKRYSAEFKARVALDAIRGEQTIAQLAARHGIHQTMINAWKKQAIEGMAGVFSGKADFCIEAVEEAMARFGRPAIFNTDQGSQFTSPRFTEVLIETGVRISMDGRGRWLDNVFIERLWRSLKYECIYLNAFETGSETRAGINQPVDSLLQRLEASFGLGRENARRGSHGLRRHRHSGITETRTKLSKAAKPSAKWGPPQ